MPKYLIERTVPGADTLTAEELRDIAAQSNAVVAGMGEPYVWDLSYVVGDKLYCVHEASGPEAIRRHAAAGGFPVDAIAEIATTIGPKTAAA